MISFAERQRVIASFNGVTAIPVYANLDPELKADPEIAKAAASYDGLILVYAPPSIKGNQEVVDVAVRNCWLAQGHAYIWARRNPPRGNKHSTWAPPFEIQPEKPPTERSPMVIYAYIRFSAAARRESGENSHVAAYHAILRGEAPSNFRSHSWYEYLLHCWPAGAPYPDSLNVAFSDHRGEHIDEVLKGLRQAIPEHLEVHQFQLAVGYAIPAGNEVNHSTAGTRPDNVVDLTAFKQAHVA